MGSRFIRIVNSPVILSQNGKDAENAEYLLFNALYFLASFTANRFREAETLEGDNAHNGSACYAELGIVVYSVLFTIFCTGDRCCLRHEVVHVSGLQFSSVAANFHYLHIYIGVLHVYDHRLCDQHRHVDDLVIPDAAP